MKIWLVFSHKLSIEQEKDLKRLGIDEFKYMPQEIYAIWSNIPPEMDEAALVEFLAPVRSWLDSAIEGEWVLVQGDYGATYNIVNYCLQKRLVPVYATTKRDIRILVDSGQTKRISTFSHVRFREYSELGGKK